MKKSSLSSLIKTMAQLNQPQYKSETGFTLIELLVVVIMIGVLASIMAPGWQTFMNRQRVNKANDAVLSAMQEAQSEAKKTKLSYSVSFKNKDGVPQVAVYRKGTDPTWRDLGQDLGIKPNQVILGTNLKAENTETGDKVEYKSDDTSNPPNQTITFDYQGALLDAKSADFAVVVSTPKSKDSSSLEPIPSLKRCVRVKTILGAMTIGRGEENTTDNPGCP